MQHILLPPFFPLPIVIPVEPDTGVIHVKRRGRCARNRAALDFELGSVHKAGSL
jgi:hypothetical protein